MTVAVVSWNTRDLLLRCLASLAPDVDAGRAAVWVVDNASGDGSAEAAREAAPWAEVVDAGENLGFGRAVNLVAARTGGEWIAAANADIALEPGALATLLDAGSDPRVGCVAPRLVLPSCETQHSVHPFPTIPFTLAFNLGLQRLSHGWAARMCLEGFWDPDRERDVPWAIGAFLLLRRSAFEAAGEFDERQWMYAEDLDLGWRLHRLGWTTRYQPGARVHHEESAVTNVAFGDEKAVRFMGATYVALARRRGRLSAAAVAAINILGAAVRLGVSTVLSRASGRWRPGRDTSRRWLRAHALGAREALRGKD